MGYFLITSVFVLALMFGVESQTCNSALPSQCSYTGAGTIPVNNAADNRYFAIGGLFDIHERGTGKFCGGKISPDGMVNLLAFYWSINKFSKDILPSGKMAVGAVAFDNCMRPDQTVENVLSFSQCKVQIQGLNQQNIVAYVGPYSNMDVARTGMLAADLNVALVSPGASALDLNREKQETLLRLRPSMEYDLKAIMAFLRSLNSNFVLMVYSSKGKVAYEKMEDMLKEAPLTSKPCQSYSFMLEDGASDTDIGKVAADIVKHNAGKYVIPFMSKEMTKKLMQATSNLNDQSLIYILHSDIGRDPSHVSNHAIIVEQEPPMHNDNDVLMDFNDFLKNVNKNASLHANLNRVDITNPWLTDFIQQKITLPDLATVSQTSSRTVMNAWRTILSVRMIIQGLHNGIQQKCAFNSVLNYQFCDALRNEADHEDELFKLIKSDKFGDDGQLKAENIVYNYYLYENSKAAFTKIGSIQGNRNTATINDLANVGMYGESFTGNLCPMTLSCCIPVTQPPTMPPTTQSTMPVTLAPKNYIEVKYPDDKEITGAFSFDESDEDGGTRFDVGQKWIIALGVLAGLGILCVLVFEIYILYKMISKKVDNKWRTMWLGQLLLFGIFLAYLTCFAFMFIPTKATCGITRFGVGVSYAICFAVLLVKLMVILTSKSSDVYIPGNMESPNYLKGVYQFLMFAFAVGVQVVINVQWLITVPPEAIKVISNSGSHVWVCNHYTWKTGNDMLNMADFVRTNFENHLLSLTYIMLLIVIITFLSLNAHGIITNHRESVFIGIAAGFSIPLWLAWGLVGSLNKDDDEGHEYGDACLAFGLFLTATLILFSMFLPKVRQLVNMGVEGIYLEDDRETIYGGSIIMAPPSYKSKGAPSSVIYVNNQGIYSEPVVVGNGDSNRLATHLKHPMSTYSAPPNYLKKTDSTYGGSRVLHVTDDLKGRHPFRQSKKPLSEVNYGTSGRPRSLKGTLPRSRSQSDLGAL